MNLKKQQRHPFPTKKPNRQIILKFKKNENQHSYDYPLAPISSKKMIDSISN